MQSAATRFATLLVTDQDHAIRANAAFAEQPRNGIAQPLRATGIDRDLSASDS